MTKQTIIRGMVVAAALVVLALVWRLRGAHQAEPDRDEQSAIGSAASGGAGENEGRWELPFSAARADRRTASAPQSGGGQQQLRAPGQKAVAKVIVGGQPQEVQPNQLGNFPRTSIAPKAAVPVEMVFPQGDPGQTIVVEAKDGGNFGGEALAQILKLDEQRRVAFTFHADTQPGIYRVSLRRGAEEAVLNFWVGEQLPVASR
jgi:hypothetical protein